MYCIHSSDKASTHLARMLFSLPCVLQKKKKKKLPNSNLDVAETYLFTSICIYCMYVFQSCPRSLVVICGRDFCVSPRYMAINVLTLHVTDTTCCIWRTCEKQKDIRISQG